ncbi:MAG: aspartate-semialdehyde dehydrogenase [Ignavibacteria bacterium]|nr:aspartate-semialdehyde dehydrogenase [Ignavibacteria bacterium]
MQSNLPTIAVVGATGLVGRTMLQVLDEHEFPIGKLRLLASARSAGSSMEFCGERYEVEELTENSFEGIDIALFSAGGAASKKYSPIAAAAGCVVVDNSSAWRMHSDVPLVVPEVNAGDLWNHHGIIANPNCSTIQLVVALKPIHEAFELKRVIVSTYQSVSGAGQKGVDHLTAEIEGREPEARISSHRIAFNTVFHSFTDDSGISEEEQKVRRETRRIMNLPDLPIAVTCVRVPILGGHGESVNIETIRPFTMDELRQVIENAEGIILQDEPKEDYYPTPHKAEDRDEVFVGRLRLDDTVENGAYLWVVADNLRKGAATNAVQIARKLLEMDCLGYSKLLTW